MDHHQQGAYYNPYEEGGPTSLNYDQCMNDASTNDNVHMSADASLVKNSSGFKKARQM